MVSEFIDNIQIYLSRYTHYYPLRISFWGNDLKDGLELNYDFQDKRSTLLADGEAKGHMPNIYLIIGALNFLQLKKLKQKLNENNEKTYIVHCVGSIPETKLAGSYMVSPSIKDELPVDFVYTNYPIDIDFIVEKLCKISREKRE